ncbi:MAG: phosphoglycerate kinase [Candidatus Gracilibacteria bacterium]
MLKTLQRLSSKSLKAKRVLVRVDFNVPQDEKGRVTDATRLEESLPTIRFLVKNGARVILMSHLGRPTPGKFEKEFKLDPIAKVLSKLLKKPVKKLDVCIGDEVEKAIEKMKNCDVVLLENTRFYAGEEKNDPKFAKALASLGDLYVNDAFGTAHRAHASTAGIAAYLPAYAGLLLGKEIKALSPLLKKTARPLVMIVGGAKIDTKIGILKNFIKKADTFLIGGGLANTFLLAEGFDVAQSLCEKNKVEVAREIMLASEKKRNQIMLPQDVVVASEISDKAATLDIPVEDVEGDMKILDLGKKALAAYVEVIKKAKTIIWNGPVGLYEKKPFERGTRVIAKAVAISKAKTILGGGDTIDAIKKFGFKFSKFDHVSTGGGAMLEFLEGKELPGIAILKK